MVKIATEPSRWAWAEIDLDAVAHNVRLLLDRAHPAAVWATVKADGFGHGAIDVARVSLSVGASGLCVALVDEGIELRRSGIEAPILVLSEQPPERIADLVDHRLSPTAYTTIGLRALHSVATDREPIGFHLKLDTGMQRVGVTSDDLDETIEVIRSLSPAIRLIGLSTHLASADRPDDPTNAAQIERFDEMSRRVLDRLADLVDTAEITIHMANSAAVLAHPATHRMAVRPGIAICGISPGHGVDPEAADLHPAMTLRARVSMVKRVRAGSAISYGHTHRFDRETTVATLPIGYADGVPRRLSSTGGEVLIGGRRRPIVGVVTMDQMMVDVGDDPVEIGDEAVLIGVQGDERITAVEWADRLGTIGYEIAVGISARIERILVGTGA